MSDNHNHGKKHIPQRELGTALRSFFDHVTSHDQKGVHAAMCVVANATPQDPDAPTQINGIPVVSVHVCNFAAGDPDVLAQMVVMAIDTMVEEVPGFEESLKNALHAKRLKSMINQVLNIVQQAKEQADEAKGMEAAKPAVDALIEKLKNNPGAVPGPDTKQ